MKTKQFTLGTLLISALIISGAASAQWNITGNTLADTGKLGSLNSFPVNVITNNASRIFISSSGNVGINTTTPSSRFYVNGSQVLVGDLTFKSSSNKIQFADPGVSSDPMINMFRTGTQNYNRMVIAHSPAYPNWGLQYSDSLDIFNFLSNGTPVLTAHLGYQRVGIGTSSPLAKFDIAGTGAYNLATSQGDFKLGSATNRLNMGVAIAGGGAGDAYIAGSGRLYLGTSNTFGRTQTMSINNTGRVGIGTFSPIARLHIIGDTGTTVPGLQVTTSYVGAAQVRGIQVTSNPGDGYGYGIQATGGLLGGYFIGDGGAYTGTAYGSYNTASGSAGTRIGVYGSASGGTVNNWGGYFPTKTYTSEIRVGTTNGATGYIASIGGKLIAEEVRVELEANWPDYVFGKDYKLLPLEDLETKINADKHLPGIPSAGEMKESGIMLGEMQTKTMEKVEENTLYIIQLNNKIKQLEKVIDELSKKIK